MQKALRLPYPCPGPAPQPRSSRGAPKEAELPLSTPPPTSTEMAESALHAKSLEAGHRVVPATAPAHPSRPPRPHVPAVSLPRAGGGGGRSWGP